MSQEMNRSDHMTENVTTDMVINRLPSRTWNWLKMNEASLVGIQKPEAENYKEKFAGNAEYDLAGEREKEIFDQIETALGKDMDGLGENIPVAVLEGTEEEKTEPVILNLTADGHYGRYFLYAKRNSQMNVAVYCNSSEEETRPFYLQLKIFGEENAKIQVTIVQTLGKQVSVFSDLGSVLEKNAALELVKMELGGKEVYSGASVELKGDRSSFKAHIGYLGEKDQHLDMNYIARHLGKKTESLMESNGVLNENAFKLFRGTIDFVKGSVGAVGNESENVLLLGDEVENQTIPLILCAEEDVEGNHGASIGELDEKTLFYLMSRGFTEEEAKKLIARSRLDAVAGMIGEPSVREKTLNYMEEHQ